MRALTGNTDQHQTLPHPAPPQRPRSIWATPAAMAVVGVVTGIIAILGHVLFGFVASLADLGIAARVLLASTPPALLIVAVVMLIAAWHAIVRDRQQQTALDGLSSRVDVACRRQADRREIDRLAQHVDTLPAELGRRLEHHMDALRAEVGELRETVAEAGAAAAVAARPRDGQVHELRPGGNQPGPRRPS